MTEWGTGSHGFEAALATYLAGGGTLRNDPTRGKAGLRFTEGRLKGKTMEEAAAQARKLWMQADPGVRAKYSRMQAGTMDAPLPPEAPAETGLELPKRIISPEPPVSRGGRPGPPLRRSLAAGLVEQSGTAWDRAKDFAGKFLGQEEGGGAAAAVAPPETKERRINPLTGRPFGWVPAPDGSDARSEEHQAELLEGHRINPLTGKRFGWVPPAGGGRASGGWGQAR